MAELMKGTCYDGKGCVHLRSRWWADGTTDYHCDLSPGIIIGESDPQGSDMGPKRCEHYNENPK